ncbi:SpoIIE family protein phosphatase [Geodermatophilus sp. SYSU D00758]
MTQPDRRSGPGTGSLPRLLAAVALGYAAGAVLSFALFEASSLGAVLFPPAGVTFATLVLTRPAVWPWVLATVAAVEVCVDLAFGLPARSVPGFVLANTVEPLVGATLLLRVTGGRPDLGRRRDLAAFIGCGVLAGPFVGALIGATTNALAFGRGWWDSFLPFWAGDGLGVLTVAGTVLTWQAGGRTVRDLAVRAALVLVTTGVTVLAFWPVTVPLAYLSLALLVAVASRCGVAMVSLAGLAVTVTANVVTAAGRGPWSELARSPNLESAALQLFLAVAVLSAWLLAVEIDERQRARSESAQESAVRRRVESLQEVTAGLATAATSEAIAGVLVRHGIGTVADSGAVGVLSPDGSRLRTWTASPDGSTGSARDVPVTSAEPVARACRAGAPLVTGDDGTSSLAVPARIGDVTVGALAFAFDSPAARDPEVAAQAETLAGLMAQALLRARLYEQEHEAAHQLQRAFLPVLPAALHGVDVAGSYRPADEEHDIGGDWYDVFPVGPGRVGFVVGDVVGHDLPAAAAMGRLHAALRVIAGGRGGGPRRVLDALDRAAADIPGAAFATIGYGEYDPITCRLRYACAGHPPPLLVADGRAAFLPDGRSLPLGVLDLPRTEAELTAPAGAMLVWYSDGLVERRDSDLDAGLERLAEVVEGLEGTDPVLWRDAVMAELTGGRQVQDDVVVLCLHLRGEGPTGPRRRRDLRIVPTEGGR